MHFSLIIIVKGRAVQLKNSLESVGNSSLKPSDIQIVSMSAEDEYSFIQEFDLPIIVHRLTTPDLLPLAAARNLGARNAQSEVLFFLDVDCIVHPTLFETMAAALKPNDVLSAYPRYLPYVPDHGTYDRLVGDSLVHPDRAAIPVMEKVSFKKFWSLVFCMTKSSFEEIGGFDESFTGYGGEDTDFAHSFNERGSTLKFVDSDVLHQYHVKYSPPLNHFEDILLNARRYYEKWHVFPMYSWLKEFQDKGLITIKADALIVHRTPSDSEIEACLSKDPY